MKNNNCTAGPLKDNSVKYNSFNLDEAHFISKGIEVIRNYDLHAPFKPMEQHNLKTRRAVKILMTHLGMKKDDMSEFYEFFEALPQSVKSNLSSSQLAETFYRLKQPLPLQ